MYSGKLLHAYVQKLESRRITLTQLEQEIQRARSQVKSLPVYSYKYVHI